MQGLEGVVSLETVYSYRWVLVLGGGSYDPGDYGVVTQSAVSGKRLTLETVDMWPHVYDLGGHPGYFRH